MNILKNKLCKSIMAGLNRAGSILTQTSGPNAKKIVPYSMPQFLIDPEIPCCWEPLTRLWKEPFDYNPTCSSKRLYKVLDMLGCTYFSLFALSLCIPSSIHQFHLHIKTIFATLNTQKKFFPDLDGEFYRSIFIDFCS